MTLLGFKANNHPQQTGKRGALDEVDDRGTEPTFWAGLNDRFHFTLDVAAAPHNAKCERYFTRADNGLEKSWRGESVWCNPPYSDLAAWVDKAWREYLYAQGIVMLVPANRTEQGWWQDYVEPRRDRPISPLRVEFLRGRLRFIRAGATEIKPNERPPFGCALLIWRHQ